MAAIGFVDSPHHRAEGRRSYRFITRPRCLITPPAGVAALAAMGVRRPQLASNFQITQPLRFELRA